MTSNTPNPNNKKQAVPSPYIDKVGAGAPTPPNLDEQRFLVELDRLCKRHRFEKYFIAFSPLNEVIDGEKVLWKSFSNTFGVNLLNYMEIVVKAMKLAAKNMKK